MKSRLFKYLFALLLILQSVQAAGQAKIYTKKARMDDFRDRTTKVVLSGESLLSLTLREEILSRWRVSPYEFCTIREYERMRGDSGYYFINLVKEGGIVFLTLSKGGIEDDADRFKRPFQVVAIPIASDGMSSGQEFGFMGAFVDIMQNFALDAMESDLVGYNSLEIYNGRKIGGKNVFLSTSAADGAMIQGLPDALSGIVIAPGDNESGNWCYRMLISCDTHELYYYSRVRFTGEADREFTDREARQFEKRYGIVTR